MKTAKAQYADVLMLQMLVTDPSHAVDTGFQGLQAHKLIKVREAKKMEL